MYIYVSNYRFTDSPALQCGIVKITVQTKTMQSDLNIINIQWEKLFCD